MSKFFNRAARFYNIIPKLLRIEYPLLEKEISLEKESNVLDVGGGTGRLASKIVNSAEAQVTVLDSSNPMLEQIKPHPRISTVHETIKDNSLSSKSFDVVVCIDALHHLKEPERGLQEMYKILKPQGKIYIQDFDITKARVKFLSFVEKHLLREPAHFYSPEKLTKIAQNAGFSGSAKPILRIQYLYKGKRYE